MFKGFNEELVKRLFTSSLTAKMAATTEFTFRSGTYINMSKTTLKWQGQKMAEKEIIFEAGGGGEGWGWKIGQPKASFSESNLVETQRIETARLKQQLAYFGGGYFLYFREIKLSCNIVA